MRKSSMLKLKSFGMAVCLCGWSLVIAGATAADPVATKEFEIRNDRAFLGGQEVRLWGIRCGNAIHSEVVTQRHIQNLDNMVAHGINLIGVYIQGSNAGWPDPNAAANGFMRDGLLKPEFAERLERIIREADKRGMVVMVGLFTPRKDQEFYDDAAIQLAIEEAARFLSTRKLRNVFIDIMHEYSHPERIDKEIFREPNGEQKKAKLTKWFKDVAPDIEVGICPDADTKTKDTYPGMDVRLIQKDMPIATTGFVVNVEMLRQDVYQNDGVFGEAGIAAVYRDCETYKAAKNSAFMFHAAFVQGITNNSGTAPHAEMGGYGKKASDRGVRFYYEWVRDNVGRYEYPRHVPVSTTP